MSHSLADLTTSFFSSCLARILSEFANLGPIPSNTALIPYLLVNRQWYPIVNKLIYEHVQFTHEDLQRDLRLLRALERDVFSGNLSKTSAVRSLKIDSSTEENLEHYWLVPFVPSILLLTIILQELASLRPITRAIPAR